MVFGRTNKLFFLSIFIWVLLPACGPVETVDVSPTHKQVVNSWNANQHTVWEIEWPNAPVEGSVTVESWRADNRYRFEILESVSPALIGETLVVNGKTAWQYNRLNPALVFVPGPPHLSPATEAFTIITTLLNVEPIAAARQMDQVNFTPAEKSTLSFENGDILNFWQNRKSGLPVKITFATKNQHGTLTARSAQPLPNPLPELFNVDVWVDNRNKKDNQH